MNPFKILNRIIRREKPILLTAEQQENVAAGLPYDFELPYPYPRNEHEDGMNYVAVNRVASGRADW